MATFPYDDFRTLAADLIGPVFGERKITLRRPSDAFIDPDKPWLGNDHNDPVEFTNVDAVFLNIRQADRLGLEQVIQGDQSCWIAAAGNAATGSPALTEEINPEWTIVDGDTDWAIVSVMKKIKPGNDVIAYLLQVRI